MNADETQLNNAPIRYRLGLDIGANSVGWAAVRMAADEEASDRPVGLLAAGVRIFEAGVEGAFEQGKDGSRAVARRLARETRRPTWAGLSR